MNNDHFEWVDWIVEQRGYKKWSQADLAHEARISRATISDYELRRRLNPDVSILSRIAIALGYPPEFLLRKAKILPPQSIDDEIIERVTATINKYKRRETKENALSLLEFLRVEEEKGDYRARLEDHPTRPDTG